MCWRNQLPPEERMNCIKDEKNRLTISEYLHLLQSLPRTVKNVDIVGGGEPLLFPEISELFKAIKKRGLCGRLITNGTFLNNKIATDLINFSWDMVRISFHAGSAETYKKVNGVDDYKRVVNNIRSLLLARKTKQVSKVSMLFVIQRQNAKEVRDFALLAERLGVDEIEYDTLIPFTPKNILLTAVQRTKLIQDLTELEKQLSVKNNIPHMLYMFSVHPVWNNEIKRNYFKDKYCQIAQSELFINSNGNIIPCCLAWEIKSKNIRSYSISKIWRYYRPFRRNLADGKFSPFCLKYCNYKLEKKRTK
ncbi:MAG: hypothetical protein A2857_02255 [Candidatus Levybacteria bacterium RIFCSPHIGHO2_01_FULL_36_15]|nr:MAG: hypothetical protein A2857_02255 [Candidatus Levybacteria bacterium RIFCSPHIGHO2_01_FULL_36_15]